VPLKKSREYKGREVLLALPQKYPKGLGPKPPKAEKPGDIPTIRKLATLKQYELLNGIPPGFSPAERFFRQRPRGYGSYEGYGESILYKASETSQNYKF